MFENKPVAEISTVSIRTRVILYVASWSAVLVAIDLRLWSLVYMFPMGLFAFLPPGTTDEKWAVPLLVLGWVIYVVHAVFYFRARRRKAIWLGYAVLLVLLVFNAGGCHHMLRGTGYGR